MYALSESSPVRLGLAVGVVVGTGALVWQLAGIRSDVSQEIGGAKEEIARTYVTKELFNARMDEMGRAIADLKSEIRRTENR